MSGPNFYRGWDCHAYTPAFRESLSSFHKYDFQRRIPQEEFNAVLQAIRAKYAPVQLVAVNKMQSRYQPANQGYGDPDLAGANVAAILVDTWQAVDAAKDESLYALFRETLQDIGGTCIQGDSHRLLAVLLALSGDEETQKEKPEETEQKPPNAEQPGQ